MLRERLAPSVAGPARATDFRAESAHVEASISGDSNRQVTTAGGPSFVAPMCGGRTDLVAYCHGFWLATKLRRTAIAGVYLAHEQPEIGVL